MLVADEHAVVGRLTTEIEDAFCRHLDKVDVTFETSVISVVSREEGIMEVCSKSTARALPYPRAKPYRTTASAAHRWPHRSKEV